MDQIRVQVITPSCRAPALCQALTCSGLREFHSQPAVINVSMIPLTHLILRSLVLAEQLGNLLLAGVSIIVHLILQSLLFRLTDLELFVLQPAFFGL